MTPDELREEVGIELQLIEDTLRELSSLSNDIGRGEPKVREKTAAAAFMAQFYGGVENILKRISRFHSVPVPTGETWHVDLFRQFCLPGRKPLPVLFDDPLQEQWLHFASSDTWFITGMAFNWTGRACRKACRI
jgi:hypothetical protein